jgi:hypothetical protein
MQQGKRRGSSQNTKTLTTPTGAGGYPQQGYGNPQAYGHSGKDGKHKDKKKSKDGKMKDPNKVKKDKHKKK